MKPILKALLLFNLLMILVACQPLNSDALPDKSFILSGDVPYVKQIKADDFLVVTVEVSGTNYPAVLVSDLFLHYEIDPNDFHLLIQFDDHQKRLLTENVGLASFYLSENGWHLHPAHSLNPSSFQVASVYFIDHQPDWSDAVHFILPDENRYAMTPGQMAQLLSSNPSFEEDQWSLPLDHFNLSSDEILVMTKSGGYYRTKPTGFLLLNGNQIDYFDPKAKTTHQNLAGILFDPPDKSIMAVYHQSISKLSQGEKVMVLFVDGFCYDQYHHASQKGLIPYLSSLDPPQKAVSVYRPVTNAGMAAMLTGEPPHINGIHDRSHREPLVPTIFDYTNEHGLVAKLIEEHVNILNVNTDTILNLDLNQDGYTDDEVFENALSHLSDTDYLMVHFHGLDDDGHAYGPFASETMSKLQELDGYLSELAAQWPGYIIITSDHGMHATDTGGNHGYFRYEDLIVPYFQTYGGS